MPHLPPKYVKVNRLLKILRAQSRTCTGNHRIDMNVSIILVHIVGMNDTSNKSKVYLCVVSLNNAIQFIFVKVRVSYNSKLQRTGGDKATGVARNTTRRCSGGGGCRYS